MLVTLQIRHVCGIGSEEWRGEGTQFNVQHGPYSENFDLSSKKISFLYIAKINSLSINIILFSLFRIWLLCLLQMLWLFTNDCWMYPKSFVTIPNRQSFTLGMLDWSWRWCALTHFQWNGFYLHLWLINLKLQVIIIPLEGQFFPNMS